VSIHRARHYLLIRRNLLIHGRYATQFNEDGILAFEFPALGNVDTDAWITAQQGAVDFTSPGIPPNSASGDPPVRGLRRFVCRTLFVRNGLRLDDPAKGYRFLLAL
jgi:hypothetical protein